MKKRFFVTSFALLTIFTSAGSLVLLAFFLFAGDTPWIATEMGIAKKLLWNAGLCLVFFVQHSLMVRRSFRHWLSHWISGLYHTAFYSMVSGCVLVGLIILWQPVPLTLFSAPNWMAWCFKGLILFTGIIILSCSRVLSGLDILGIGPLIHKNRPISTPPGQLVIKGPYRWVRHPLYMSFLIIAWAEPQLTADRLLFNILWTAWVCFATHLEEKDLIVYFGKPYKDYRQKVPMIFPTSLGPRL